MLQVTLERGPSSPDPSITEHDQRSAGHIHPSSDTYSPYLSLEPAADTSRTHSHLGLSPLSSNFGVSRGNDGSAGGPSRLAASSHNSATSAQGLLENGDSEPSPQINHLRLAGRILLISLGLFAAVIVPIIVWLWYIFVFESTYVDWKNGLVYTTTTGTRFNLIANVSCKVVSLLIGQVLATHAYVAASEWLASSKSSTINASIKKLPTPMQ
jgi:hypothetical protein